MKRVELERGVKVFSQRVGEEEDGEKPRREVLREEESETGIV